MFQSFEKESEEPIFTDWTKAYKDKKGGRGYSGGEAKGQNRR